MAASLQRVASLNPCGQRQALHPVPSRVPICRGSRAVSRKLQFATPSKQRNVSAAVGPNTTQMLVYAIPHPLIRHWLAIARNAATPPALFRGACAELGRLLIYEAVREFLPTLTGEVDTPVDVADVEFVDPTKPVKVIPILRAGLVLLEQAQTVLPASETYHVGYVRSEDTLEASCYLNKLPKQFSPDDLILITDPMLATGGTIVKVLEEIVAKGGNTANVRIICVVAAAPALQKLAKFKGLKVFTAMIDEKVNEKGYIVPGLGDAGDRAFGTL